MVARWAATGMVVGRRLGAATCEMAPPGARLIGESLRRGFASARRFHPKGQPTGCNRINYVLCLHVQPADVTCWTENGRWATYAEGSS